MKKLMLIGSTSSGKTTLTQALYGQEANVEYSRKILKSAGFGTIFEISSVTGDGLDELKNFLGFDAV